MSHALVRLILDYNFIIAANLCNRCCLGFTLGLLASCFFDGFGAERRGVGSPLILQLLYPILSNLESCLLLLGGQRHQVLGMQTWRVLELVKVNADRAKF